MSEPKRSKSFSNTQTLIFVVLLSFICALILSVLASALAEPKEVAKDLDRSKQMLIAAKILNHEGQFILQDSSGAQLTARYEADGFLIPDNNPPKATNQQILEIYRRRLIPAFVDEKGQLVTLEKSGIELASYINDYRKTGYYKQPLKLLYQILPNQKPGEAKSHTPPIGYVIPVNGYGLWDAIYGYLAVKPDGDTVIGISWYDQKETPGLGANITEDDWQKQFAGKKVFTPGPEGKTDYKAAPLGITVVRGYVVDVLGSSPKAKSSVDGMSGATLTGNGVTDAYKDVLSAYRKFLVKLHEDYSKHESK